MGLFVDVWTEINIQNSGGTRWGFSRSLRAWQPACAISALFGESFCRAPLCLPPPLLCTADWLAAVSRSLKQHIYLCINDITTERKGTGGEKRGEDIRQKSSTQWSQDEEEAVLFIQLIWPFSCLEWLWYYIVIINIHTSRSTPAHFHFMLGQPRHVNGCNIVGETKMSSEGTLMGPLASKQPNSSLNCGMFAFEDQQLWSAAA